MKTFAKVSLIVAGISLSAGIALTVIGAIANKGKPIRMYYDHGFHLDSEGKIIEMRSYQTVYGVWKYMTVSGNIHIPGKCNVYGL